MSFITTSSPTITAALTSTTNPAFLGWMSVTSNFGTPVYSIGSCQGTSTFTASSTYATCCGISCPVYTSCASNSILIGSNATSTCTASSTCKTDIIYQTDVPTKALYCETGLPVTWYRAMPTPGIDSSTLNATSTSNNQTPWGTIGGGAGGGVMFLIIAAILFCCCCGGGRSSGGDPNDNDDYYERQRDMQRRQAEEIAMRESARQDANRDW